MKILFKEDIEKNKEFYINEIKLGKIFIYPTDTLYGIGCDATNDKNVREIYLIKKRENKPYLIIIPNFAWLKKNIEVNEKEIKIMKERFLSQNSFIVKLKDKSCISKYTNNNQETIGIRYPNHWFTQIIEQANLPFITTSVNFSGEPSATLIDTINPNILNQVDYVIKDDKNMTGKPSKIINLIENKTIRN